MEPSMFDHGNGNRGKVPMFSEDDRSIPAYIRRMENQ
jgi:hypothetical protein